MMPSKLFFLPGALGRMDFWLPSAALLRTPAEQVHIGWPGFGPTPARADVNGIDDLVDMVVKQIDGPCALIAQSMGGIVAIRAALARPEHVTHLVLAATSGGLDMTGLGAQDWRAFVRIDHPALPDWFLNEHTDLAPQLPALPMPALLLWGDADPISPVAVGQQLAAHLPHATLHVFAGADHDLAYTHAAEVAALVDRHLAN